MTAALVLKFIAALAPEIGAIIEHAISGESDAEKERQLGMNLIRKAKDLQAKREIEGD